MPDVKVWPYFLEIYLGPSKVSPVVKATGSKSYSTHSLKVGKPLSAVCQLSPSREGPASKAAALLMHYPVTHHQCSLQSFLPLLEFSTLFDDALQSNVRRQSRHHLITCNDRKDVFFESPSCIR